MEIISKHCRKLIMELLDRYPKWSFFLRWGFSIIAMVCMTVISFAFAYSLIK